MRLGFDKIDMRGGYGPDTAWQTKVIDLDTGRQVCFVHHQRSPGWRLISLFGGKYQRELSTHEQCVAFAMGVEAVLNHMVSSDIGDAPNEPNSN